MVRDLSDTPDHQVTRRNDMMGMTLLEAPPDLPAWHVNTPQDTDMRQLQVAWLQLVRRLALRLTRL